MLRQRVPKLGVFWLALLGGCSNPCQQLCVEMANYAEDCGMTVSSEDVKNCSESFSDVEDNQAQQCQDWNDANKVRDWWTCDDIADNFQKGG